VPTLAHLNYRSPTILISQIATMVQYYTIFGQKVGSHILSIATLSTLSVVGWASTRGKPASKEPPINAQSKEEESFVKEFIKKTEEKAKS